MDTYTDITRVPPCAQSSLFLSWKKTILLIVLLFSVVFLLCVYLHILNSPPREFKTYTNITIRGGLTVNDITEILHNENIVRSPTLLRAILKLSFDDAYIQAGTYYFTKELSTYEIADAFTHGLFLAPSIRVTFPEGFSLHDWNTYMPEDIPMLNTAFIESKEGFLFPDTYFLDVPFREEDLIERMKSNYESHISPIRARIVESGMTEREIITLASILEREANDDVSMREVAGILKHRLHIDMPLQIDAVFTYILGKTSAELTEDDLDIDSPYNTYRHRGLPPTPIGNPGMKAIMIALESEPSENLYYLTGNNGTFYYAKTFEEHRMNKIRYLR